MELFGENSAKNLLQLDSAPTLYFPEIGIKESDYISVYP